MDYREFLGQLLDCDTSYNKGCNGGDKDHAFAFIVESSGIHATDDYSYTGKDEGCYALASKKKRKAFWVDGDEELPADHKTRKVVCIDGYEGLPANEEQSLLKAVANQPVSVSIEAGSRDFQFCKIKYIEYYYLIYSHLNHLHYRDQNI
ncbi:putative zingipain [Helianthus anomalus]